MWQTPFADLVRSVTGLRVIAVGNIHEPDQVNTIVAAGRADLCAIARPHLVDAAWTQRAAAEQRYAGQAWPPQYLSGRSQFERNLERAAQPAGHA
jgi:anthraniloyl-CoA monooxygenase